MQKVKKDITENVMEKIHKEKIEMKPKSYFVLGSIAVFLGVIASVVSSVFLVSIISFLLKSHGPMGEYRLSLMLESFPLWLPILAVFGIVFGILMLKKYDFSYKLNFWFIILGFLIAIVVAGFAIDLSGIDNFWMNKGPMRGVMNKYLQNDDNYLNNISPTSGFQRGRGQGGRWVQDF